MAAELQNEAFEQLAMPLFDSLYNFAHWLTRNREEAEDLVQETYAKALRGFASFQAGNFRAWMFRILRNTFLTSRTGLARTSTVALDEEEEQVAIARDTPETVLLQTSDIEAVRRAIEQLPLPFREAILLADVEEMSYREIAEALEVPIGTVMSRLARGRRALRKALEKKHQEAQR